MQNEDLIFCFSCDSRAALFVLTGEFRQRHFALPQGYSLCQHGRKHRSKPHRRPLRSNPQLQFKRRRIRPLLLLLFNGLA
jgi:hypothetical protein